MSIKDQDLNQSNQQAAPSGPKNSPLQTPETSLEQLLQDQLAGKPETPTTMAAGPSSPPKQTPTDSRQIVQVTYFSESTGKASGRAYAYYGAPGETHLVEDIVMVPVAIRGSLDPNETRLQKAKVVDASVPPANIEAFKDKVRTIPPPAADQARKILDPEPETVAETTPEPDDIGYQADAITEDPNKRDLILAGDSELSTAVMVIAYPERDGTYLQLAGQVKDLIVRLDAHQVTDQESAGKAADDLSMVLRLKRALTKRQTEYTKPVHDLHTSFIATFKAILDPLEASNLVLKSKLGVWTVAEQAKADDARKAAAIAEVERMGQADVDEETGEIHEPPDAPAPPPAAVSPTTRGLQGVINTKMVKKFTITHPDMVDRKYCSPDPKLVKDAVDAGIKKIDGVYIYEEPAVTVKR